MQPVTDAEPDAEPDAASPRERRRAQRQETRRREIVAVAEDLFAEHGYDGTSLEKIADGSGYSVGGIYNFFTNKEAVYLAVLEHRGRVLAERVMERAGTHDTGMDTLLDMAETAIITLREFPDRAQMTLQQTARSHLTPAGRGNFRALLETYATAIREGQRDGTVRDGDPRQLAQYVGGLVLAHMQIDPEIAGHAGETLTLEDFRSVVRGALGPTLAA